MIVVDYLAWWSLGDGSPGNPTRPSEKGPSALRSVAFPGAPFLSHSLLVSPPTYSRRPYRSHTCSALFHFCPLSRCCATRPVEGVPTSSPSIRLTVRKSPRRSLSQTSRAMPIMLAVIGRPSSFARVRSICNSATNFCCVITGAPGADGERHSNDKSTLHLHDDYNETSLNDLQTRVAKMIFDQHEMASVHNAPRLPEGSLSVLVGRHGAMNPAGRVRCNMWTK